jgi:uracil-DNA glycosylase family 4
VPFIGPRTSKLALVGEYPGATEAKKLEPMVGNAGQLLDAILDSLGLTRADVRIGNAILCGPVTEDDREAKWYPEVVERCATRCAAENDLGDAKVVVTLGGTGAWSLLGKRVVLGGKWPNRGAVFHTTDNRIVIPTWNPAAILKAGGSDSTSRLSDADAETISLDILRGWRLSTGELSEFQPMLRMEYDPKVFATWCRSCDWRVSIDVETDSIDPMTCKLLAVGLARRFPPREPMPFHPQNGIGSDVPTLRPADKVEAISFWWPNADDAAREAFRDLLDNGLVDKVYFNGSYDDIVLKRLIGPVNGGRSDPLYLTHARFPDVRVNLASTAQTWLAVKPWKYAYHTSDHAYEADVERAQEKGYRIPTWTEERVMALLEYNAMDAATTLAIEAPLVDECEREGVLGVAAIDVALSQEAQRMTERGVLIDPEIRDRLAHETEGKLQAAEERLRRLVDEGMRDPVDREAAAKLEQAVRENDGKFSYRSPTMLNYAFDVCGVKVPAGKGSLTKTGQRALNKKALAAISDNPLVAAVSGCRGLARTISTFFAEGKGVMALGPDGRLHMPWKVHGTPTGRWSSGADRDDEGEEDSISINLQNWPEWLRAMVVAPPGHVLVGADEAQLEYRIMALLSGEEILLRLFNDPTRPDLHNNSCERLYGIRWEAINPDLADNPFEKNRRKVQRKALRTVTKNGLYAAAYLAKWETVQKTLQARSFRESDEQIAEMLRRVSKTQCLEFIDAFPRLWPTLDAWRKWAVRDAEENHEVRCPFSGRRRIWPLGMVDPSQAVNTRVQTAAGSLVNERFLYLTTALPPEARIILQVHDSVAVECPVEMAERVRKLVEDTMTTTLDYEGHSCIFLADGKIGHAWNEV